MEIDRKELKRQARERMALTDPKFWAVALAYLAMTTGVSWVISAVPIPYSRTALIFLQLLLTLYTTVVQFGLCLWALWTYRQLDPGINSLMQGFSVAGRVVFMELGICVRVIGWYFLGAIALSVPLLMISMMSSSQAVVVLAAILFVAGLVALLTAVSLRYALAPYLLADRPDDGASIPIYRSVALMRGWKWELFKLEFSFIGYEIVNAVLSGAVIVFFLYQGGLLSPGIIQDLSWADRCIAVINSTPAVILSTLVTVPVSLWLLPYRATARAGFYDARLVVSSQETPTLPEMPPL